MIRAILEASMPIKALPLHGVVGILSRLTLKGLDLFKEFKNRRFVFTMLNCKTVVLIKT